jgi:hypothetical protein
MKPFKPTIGPAITPNIEAIRPTVPAKPIQPGIGISGLSLPAEVRSQLRRVSAVVKTAAASPTPRTTLLLTGAGASSAAEGLAGDAGRQLYRIDLSLVLSPYIGETEKNLDQVFARAESNNWILFFDEADALFGKRTEVKDAHDKYANIEVDYLLQKMESYRGMVIVATKGDPDVELEKVFRYVVRLPHRPWP